MSRLPVQMPGRWPGRWRRRFRRQPRFFRPMMYPASWVRRFADGGDQALKAIDLFTGLVDSRFRARLAKVGTQHIEIAPFIGLLDMLGKQVSIATSEMSFWRSPGCPARGHFLIRHIHINAPRLHIQADSIAGAQ